MGSVIVDESAEVDETASLGRGCRVWHLAQVREGARLGSHCVVGRGAYIGAKVRIGSNVKVQNYALIYEPAQLGPGVFVGPAAVLTNDRHPRAVTVTGEVKTAEDWSPVGVTVREGASLGAHSVCVAPVTIGRWAVVGAGAVVVMDVPDYGIVVGVPARRIGWAGPSGTPLERCAPGRWLCRVTGQTFIEEGDLLRQERA